MKIYLDIFFLVNAGMNFVVLMIESFFQRRRIRLWRLALASAVGALLSVGVLVLGIHRYIWFFLALYLVVSAGILGIAFGRTTAGALIRNLIIFYVSAFLLAGMLMQLQNFLNIRGSSFLLLISAGSILYVTYRMVPAGKRWKKKTEQYFSVSLAYQCRSVHGNGLLDTGNHLTEPFSHKPVTIGEKKFIAPLFSHTEKPALRYIPFHSIGKTSGLLPVFQAEYLEVHGPDGLCHREEKPWIAIYDSYVSADGEYEMLLHPDMLINL